VTLQYPGIDAGLRACFISIPDKDTKQQGIS
jgi:hypothetical protein